MGFTHYLVLVLIQQTESAITCILSAVNISTTSIASASFPDMVDDIVTTGVLSKLHPSTHHLEVTACW